MKKNYFKLLILLVISTFFILSCGKKDSQAGGKVSKNLVLYTSSPIEFMEPIINEFENETGIKVEIVAAGTGELLKRIEAESANPLGDIMWGGTFSSLQTKEEFFEEYRTPNEEAFFDEYKNVTGKITSFSLVPSVIMINTNLAGDIKIEGYEDLLNPALKGHIANADPAKSSSSFEHLINQLYAMGNGNPDNGWEYVEKFVANLDGKLLSGSSAVHKGVADGEYSVGLIYEEGAVNYVRDGASIKIVYPSEGTIVKPDGVAIIKGAKNLENAKKFLGFLTTKETQMLVSESNRRSVRKDVELGEGLTKLESIKLINSDQDWVNANKTKLLDRYKEIITGN